MAFMQVLVMFAVLTFDASFSAMVAQDKVLEMVHQHILSASSGDPLSVEESETKQAMQLVEPLSLQLAVLQVTDSLNREMSLPKWQAMLRALGGDREILKRFAQLRPSFSNLENQIGQRGDERDIDSQFADLARLPSSSWSRLWPQLQTLIRTVFNLHDWFDRYQRNAAVVNERTLRDYAETVHGQDGLTTNTALESLHKAVCPSPYDDDKKYGDDFPRSANVSHHCSGGAFESLKTSILQANEGMICSYSKSPHQLVYDLYTLLALTDAKGYAMMQFSWMLLRLYGKGNFSTESSMARAEYERRIIEKAQAAQTILSRLPTWIWNCDLPATHHRENETYIRFTELLQGYVVNEVDLNQDNTCKESCSTYTSSQEKSCFDKKFCSKSRRCSKGRIYNCGFVEADSTVCTTNITGRRYDWVEYKSGRTFGDKSECTQPGEEQHRVDSWWRWLFWHCSYCMCLCDQPGFNSDRYVSLQPARVATSSNRLVTGVRFVKRDRMVHIQIQEAEALPRGMVNISTLHWQPITPVAVPKSLEDSTEDGPGYATLRYEERALDLDDLVAPHGYVVTGLRFRKLGGHLNLEVQASPIDFATGIIDAERATIVSNDNTPATDFKPRTKLSLPSPDVPIRSPTPSIPDSVPDSYVEFQASSLEKDVSQTTIPFLDALPVSASPPTWLTGIGIYHKGQPGYGGFLAFRIATINNTEYMTLPVNSHNHAIYN